MGDSGTRESPCFSPPCCCSAGRTPTRHRKVEEDLKEIEDMWMEVEKVMKMTGLKRKKEDESV